jgi:Tfp pilus assembly protein FimT
MRRTPAHPLLFPFSMMSTGLPESRRFWLDSRGFHLTELLVLVAVIGIVTTVSAPAFVSYWRSATLKGGAQELATILNRGRSVAIGQNTTVCVKQSTTKVQFLTGGCAGTVWRGPGTDGNGWFTLENNITVSSATANVIFNYLGAATTAGSYTVQNPINNATMTVTVALSGRVTIGP